MVFSLCMKSSGKGVHGEATESGLVYTPLEPSKSLKVYSEQIAYYQLVNLFLFASKVLKLDLHE